MELLLEELNTYARNGQRTVSGYNWIRKEDFSPVKILLSGWLTETIPTTQPTRTQNFIPGCAKKSGINH